MSFLFNFYANAYDRFMNLFKLNNNDYILEMFKDIKDKKICDVGGGTGLLADKLQCIGNKVTIIDPCLKMTNIALMRNKNIKVISSTPLDCNIENKFDYIIFRDSLHHINNQKETLEKCLDMLLPNGYIIIQDFSPRSKFTKLIFVFERFCLEKISPVYEEDLLKTMNSLFIKGDIVYLNKRDYIFIGKKVDSCQR